MFLTYQKYLLSIETTDSEDPNFDFDFDSELDDWNQYFDIESQTIINSKNKNHYILFPYIQFRQLPTVKRKNQNSKSDIDVLETIKEEDPEIFEDIETGKIETETETNTNKNKNIYMYLINLQHSIVTLVFYISHVVFIVFLLRI